MEYKNILFNLSSKKLNDNLLILFDESWLKSNGSGAVDVPALKQRKISSKIIDFYRVVNSYEVIWTWSNNQECRGFVKIIPLKDSIQDSSPDYLCGLRILDYFVPEACVGYYIAEDGGKPNEELYFLFFQDKPQGLNVDMEGYIQLLNMSGGFAYWQETLLFLQGNPEATPDSVEKFKKYMPIIFPTFKWEEFVALYEKVKLR